MKKLLLLTALLTSTTAFEVYGQITAGPSPYPQELVQPIGPAELCLPDGCNPVNYSFESDGYAVAKSQLPNGYVVRGDAGPCLVAFPGCQNIAQQAYDDLERNALTITRAQRY